MKKFVLAMFIVLSVVFIQTNNVDAKDKTETALATSGWVYLGPYSYSAPSATGYWARDFSVSGGSWIVTITNNKSYSVNVIIDGTNYSAVPANSTRSYTGTSSSSPLSVIIYKNGYSLAGTITVASNY